MALLSGAAGARAPGAQMEESMRAMLVGTLLTVCGLLALGGARAGGEDGSVDAAVTADAVPLEFVGQAVAARNSAAPWITLPSDVVPGDRLVLLLSLNAADRQVASPTGAGGWAQEGNRSSGSMRTVVWSKIAEAGDAGAVVTMGLSASAKSTVQVAAYRGVDEGALGVVGKSETTTSTTRTTPVTTAPEGAWMVSYWAAKASNASTWTPPAEVTARGSAFNTGSGRILSLLADSAAPVPGGNYGNLAAITNTSTTKATTWTITLPAIGTEPGPGAGEVPADRETDPVGHSGDAADDPAVWAHPTTPASSLVIGNNKLGALEVYDLQGTRVQRITTGTKFWGNVDVRQGVTIGSRTLDLVVAYNAGLRTFDVDAVAGQLVPAGDSGGAILTGGGEGLCAYHSATGEVYAFAITRAGRVRQFLLHDDDGDGLLEGTQVREFEVGSEAEGCVADDVSGQLYISEEDVGLWRYGADPGAGSTRTLVDTVGPGGHLVYDVEGVTLAQTGTDSGFLIVSAQNGAQPDESYFAVYDRATNDYVSSFRIGPGELADGCERTDGITAYAGYLGDDFPSGVFVCQDNLNSTPAAGNQNFKLTRLEKVLP